MPWESKTSLKLGAFVDAMVVTVACQFISHTNLAAGSVVVDTTAAAAFTSPDLPVDHIYIDIEVKRRCGPALKTIALALFLIAVYGDAPGLRATARRRTLTLRADR